jgi:acylphosphatase
LKVRAHIFVRGFVQGVFFRSSTAQEARARGVAGWVKNLPDGRVEALLEGEEEAVKQVLAFCRKGPRGAVVTGLEIFWEPYIGDLVGFRVL